MKQILTPTTEAIVDSLEGTCNATPLEVAVSAEALYGSMPVHFDNVFGSLVLDELAFQKRQWIEGHSASSVTKGLEPLSHPISHHDSLRNLAQSRLLARNAHKASFEPANNSASAQRDSSYRGAHTWTEFDEGVSEASLSPLSLLEKKQGMANSSWASGLMGSVEMACPRTQDRLKAVGWMAYVPNS